MRFLVKTKFIMKKIRNKLQNTRNIMIKKIAKKVLTTTQNTMIKKKET